MDRLLAGLDLCHTSVKQLPDRSIGELSALTLLD
jgi:hypothetical protein